MPLLPSYCNACQRARLVDMRSVVDGGCACSECGATARTLPGQMYEARDVSLFNELEATLREAHLSPLNAVQIGVELEDRNTTPGRGLKRMATLLPSLAILELIVSDEPTMMRKAEGMLATLLDAIASTRGLSGMVPVLGALRSVKIYERLR